MITILGLLITSLLIVPFILLHFYHKKEVERARKEAAEDAPI